MNREGVTPSIASVRRCPNCGTRVAQNAETCYFCGHNLTKVPRTRRRITWVDLALVVGLLFVVVLWWRMAGDTGRPTAGETATVVASPVVTMASASTDASEVIDPTVETATSQPPPANEILIPNPFTAKHTVQSGETLLGISGRYGVTVDQIKSANNLQSDIIRVGDELIIPVPESVAETDGNPTISSVFKYKVQSGDTVVSIATRFGTQIEKILQANNMSPSDLIRPAQILLVPVEQVPSVVLASSEAARTLDQSQQAVYESPRLIGPQNAETIVSSEQILFRWISVDLLATNEWYVLRIWPLDGTLDLPPSIWTKTNSYRLSTEWAPPSGRSARYGWQVTVVRLLPDLGDGREIQAASIPSEVRTFTWQ
jgi:LysM repeat protein/predicted nucleic acid-binding Zn ribbon protein